MLPHQLQPLIEKLMRRHNIPVLYPEEHGYVSLSARLIATEINAWLSDNGIQKKIQFNSARAWLNRSCPDWVLIGLRQRLDK